MRVELHRAPVAGDAVQLGPMTLVVREVDARPDLAHRIRPERLRPPIAAAGRAAARQSCSRAQRMPARMNDCTNWRWNSRKRDQQRRRRHQRGGGDDRPVDALVGRREHLQADRQRPRLDRVGDDQRPQEVVPVVAHRDQRVGEVDRPGERHVDPPQHLQRRSRPRPAPRRRAPAARVLKVWRSRKMPKAEAKYGRPMAEDRVEQAERAHRPVVLDDQHVGHDHQLHQHQREQHVRGRGTRSARRRRRPACTARAAPPGPSSPAAMVLRK